MPKHFNVPNSLPPVAKMAGLTEGHLLGNGKVLYRPARRVIGMILFALGIGFIVFVNLIAGVIMLILGTYWVVTSTQPTPSQILAALETLAARQELQDMRGKSKAFPEPFTCPTCEGPTEPLSESCDSCGAVFTDHERIVFLTEAMKREG